MALARYLALKRVYAIMNNTGRNLQQKALLLLLPF